MKIEISPFNFHEYSMQRTDYITKIEDLFQVNPVVALLGPRQCGKTTIARQYITTINTKSFLFDLENPIDLSRLDAPMLALSLCDGLIVIDEIQLRPDLFPVLRVLIDNHPDRRWLILGSASRDLIRQSSETLAGRISYLEMMPFSLTEVHDERMLWIRGGFPRAYLASNDRVSYQWRQDYISTFLERDIPMLGFQIPARSMRRFWMMLTHYHGQTFNASEIGRSFGVSHVTARHYLDILTGTFMMRELTPWWENISKRQVKAPKVYFRDSGIFHALLGVEDEQAMFHHPKLGASWEGFAIEQIINHLNAKPEDCYYWGIHGQAELDLLIIKDGKRLGFEFKYTDSPKINQSMNIAYEYLQLDSMVIITPGNQTYPLSEHMSVFGLVEYLK